MFDSKILNYGSLEHFFPTQAFINILTISFMFTFIVLSGTFLLFRSFAGSVHTTRPDFEGLNLVSFLI